MPPYVIDANIWINVWRNHPPDIYVNVWQRIDAAIADGTIRAPSRAFAWTALSRAASAHKFLPDSEGRAVGSV